MARDSVVVFPAVHGCIGTLIGLQICKDALRCEEWTPVCVVFLCVVRPRVSSDA